MYLLSVRLYPTALKNSIFYTMKHDNIQTTLCKAHQIVFWKVSNLWFAITISLSTWKKELEEHSFCKEYSLRDYSYIFIINKYDICALYFLSFFQAQNLCVQNFGPLSRTSLPLISFLLWTLGKAQVSMAAKRSVMIRLICATTDTNL